MADSKKIQNHETPGSAFWLAAESWAQSGKLDEALVSEMNEQLCSIYEVASETGHSSLAEATQTLADLLQIAQFAATEPGESPQVDAILPFVAEHADVILSYVDGDRNHQDRLPAIRELAWSRWGDSLQLIAEGNEDVFEMTDADPAEDDFGDGNDASEQIDLVLSVLAGEAAADPEPAPEPEPELFATAENDGNPPPNTPPVPPSAWPVCQELLDDAELRDAFFDDANRCLAEMESVVLDATSWPDEARRVQSFCRQLHTLKGASASVGLEQLAGYLHEVEAWLERRSPDEQEKPDDEFLLAAVDAVRNQMAAFEAPAENPPAATASAEPAASDRPAPPAPVVAASPSIGGPGNRNEATVRIRASQLDKLMDMLAELVAIRNHREARFGELSGVNQELMRCSNRLRRFNDSRGMLPQPAAEPEPGYPATTTRLIPHAEPSSTNVIEEIANDLVAVSRELGSSFQPLASENVTLSQFIRHFRQELMQLRRLPVAGLFQRLKRSIRDAARAEDKQVEIQLVGEETGLEQSIQERLYEPLLHMVRNSVSHGIEPAAARQAARKPVAGTITLHASASASMLVIKVQDDGQGLDFAALRRRGMERGLLAPGSNPSDRQLAKLIFHPGFSTRDSASQISGRGIGMDVVATTLDRMRGRIEVDSIPDQGTTICISIPLTTGIEHVMQFRSGNQLFALPMSAIRSVNVNDVDARQTTIVSLADVLQLATADTSSPNAANLLMLDESTGMRVDEVLGPDEVVVRALPEMLRRHPLLDGVILSASGTTVLLLNPDLTRQWCRDGVATVARQPAEDHATDLPADGNPSRQALVVDDSLSARGSLAKRLRARGFAVTEAGDGLEALRCLRDDHFDLITTDLDMPRMGGLELLNEIRQGRFFDTPVVVVSSRAREEVWPQISDSGALAYLNKPASEAALNDVLRQLETTPAN